MPNETNDNPFGLDYGPAPLDVKAAAENALKKGKPLSLDELSAAAGRAVSADELDKAAANVKLVNPIAEGKVSLGGDSSPPGYKPTTARQLVLDLAQQKGLNLGDALMQFADAYDKNLAGVQLLPDAAEVRQSIGGKVSRFVNATAESAAKPVAYLGSKLPGEIGKPFAEALAGMEEKAAEQPSGLFTPETFGHLAGYALDMAAIEPLTTAAVGAILPRVPWAIKGADAILQSVKGGEPVTAGMIDAAESALVRAARIEKLAGEAATFAGTDVARGESPKGDLEFLAGITGLKIAARFSGLAGLAAKIGLGKTAGNIAEDYLTRATGKSQVEIGTLAKSGEEILDALNSFGAPAVVKQKVFNSATMENQGYNFAQYLGLKAGEWRASPEQLDEWIGSAPDKFKQAARESYNQATGNWRAADKAVPIQVVDQPVPRGDVDLYFTPLSQWARSAAKADYVTVAPRVFERPLMVDYKAEDMAAGKLPADVVVERLAAEHPEGAKALQILHTPWEGSDTQGYNNMILQVAGKLAKDRGFGAIRVNGPTVAEDFVADLSRLGNVDLDKIMEDMNNRLPEAAVKVVRGAPAVEPMRSVGAMEVPIPKSPLASEKPRPVPENPVIPEVFRYNAKRDLANIERLKQRLANAKDPIEADFAKKDLSVAVRSYVRDFPDKPNPLEPNASKVVGIRGNVPRGGDLVQPPVVFGTPEVRTRKYFNELITPEGKSLVTNELMHRELLSHTDYAKEANPSLNLAKAIKDGFVRAGRMLGEVFVEFNHDNPQARARAADFIALNYKKGDTITMDIYKGGSYKTASAADVGSALKTIETAANYPWVKRVTNIREFLGVPLAVGAGAAAAAAYSMLEPDQAQASPLSDIFLKAAEKESSGIVEKMGQAATEESIVAAGKQAAQEQGEKAAANAGKVSLSDNILNHATAGTAPTPEGRRFLGLFGNNYGVKGGSFLRLIPDMSDHPLWQMFWARFGDDKDIMLTGIHSVENQFINKAGEILDTLKVDPVADSPEFRRAFEGLQMQPNGIVKQVFTDLEPKIADAAQRVKAEIIDPLFEEVKGVSIQAHSIAAKYGIKDEPREWEKLKWLQDTYDPLDPKNNTYRGKFPTADEIQAAQETRGMLNFTDSNDLKVKYNEGQFTILPIKNERAVVANRIEELVKAYPNGLPSDKLLEMDALKNRIGELDKAEAAAMVRKPPDMYRLKRRQAFGPITREQLDIPEISQEQDLGKILRYHISGVTNKIFWDRKLTAGRKLAAMLESSPYALQSGEVIPPNPNLASKLVENLNLLRGLRSVRDDQTLANTFNGLFKTLGMNPRLGIQAIRDHVSNIMWFQYLTKVALNPGFPLMNAGQPSLSTSIVTGWRHLLEGYAKALTDYDRAYKEAEAAGVLKFESGYAQELGRKKFMTPVMNALDWLPSKTENMNRIVTFHAAKAQALEGLARGNFQVPSYVMWFDRGLLETGTEDQIANAYAKAVVRTTQFMFGPEGKSQFGIGGGWRRLSGQFKSFTAGYLTLAKNVLKYTAQTKDFAPLSRMVGSLLFFGGGSAVVGNTIYDMVRHEALKNGIPLPAGSLLGVMTDWAGQVTPLNEMPEVRDAINAIQASGRFNPLNLPSGDQILSWLAGPTFGSAIDAAGYGLGALTGKTPPNEAAAKAAQSLLGPMAAKAPSALQEFGLINDLGIGYRGGSYSPTGRKLTSDKEPVFNVLARAMNLQPPPRVKRWEYLADLKSALEGGQMNMAEDILKQAERDNVIITGSDVSGVMGKITRERREAMPNQ